MIKTFLSKYGVAAMLLMMMVLAAFFLRAYDNQFKVGYNTGYEKRSLEESVALAEAQTKISDLERANLQQIVQHNQELNSYESQLTEARQYDTFTPEVQTTSICNPVRGTISMLNSAAGYAFGSSENPKLDPAMARETSTVAEPDLVAWAGQCAESYESLRLSYLHLSGLLENAGLLSDRVSGGHAPLAVVRTVHY